MDWKTRLREAIKTEPTEIEKRELERQADDWAFCYIGENRSELMKAGFDFLSFWLPEDNELYNLGVEFASAVGSYQYELALSIAEQIDNLALERQRKVE